MSHLTDLLPLFLIVGLVNRNGVHPKIISFPSQSEMRQETVEGRGDLDGFAIAQNRLFLRRRAPTVGDC